MSNLVAAVERSILLHRLLRRDQSVVVAVSGGLDSMALWHVLHELAAKHKWRLVVAHFNHRLRGAESDDDERFVKETATRWRLKCVAGRADVCAVARRDKTSIEMAARKLRHDFLAGVGKRLKIATVALAHHADDQVELFLLRLLRGSGSQGLAGMKWTSPSPADPAIGLVRPLLDQPKSGLRRFAEEQKIAFREDATNAQLDLLRNRIRHKLLPLLCEKYQPATAKSILRTMDILGAETEFVRQAAEKWLRLGQWKDFEKLDRAVQRQVVQIQLIQMGIAPEFELVERLRCTADRAVPVEPGFNLYRDHAGGIKRQSTKLVAFNSRQVSVDLGAGRGAVEFGGLQIEWEVQAGAALARRKLIRKENCEHFDADKVGSAIILRHWRPGDRFEPIGMKSPIKLQDLFVNQKIPRARRHQLVVASTLAGEPFWVEGIRIGERFKLDTRTVRRLNWRWLGHESMVAGEVGPC